MTTNITPPYSRAGGASYSPLFDGYYTINFAVCKYFFQNLHLCKLFAIYSFLLNIIYFKTLYIHLALKLRLCYNYINCFDLTINNFLHKQEE